jgi:hypothetical protein
MHTVRCTVLLFAVSATLGFVGCASNQPAYVPDAGSVERIKPMEARRRLEGVNALLSRTTFENGIPIKSIKVVSNKTLVLNGKNGATYPLPLNNLQVSAGICCLGGWAAVTLNGDWTL